MGSVFRRLTSCITKSPEINFAWHVLNCAIAVPYIQAFQQTSNLWATHAFRSIFRWLNTTHQNVFSNITIVFTILIHIYYFEQRYKFILLRSEDMQVDIYTQFGVGITSLSSEHVIYCKPSGITSLSLEHVIYCKPSLNQCSRLSNEDWKNVTDQSITHAATRSSIVATLFGQAKLIESRYLSLFYSAHIPLTCVILAYVHHH